MVHPVIIEVFEKYVQKFALEQGNFGIAAGFLDPDLTIVARNGYNGHLHVRSQTFSKTYNCARAAAEMVVEYRERGFQVNRKFTTSSEGYTQNYVHVFDPDSNRWVQVDATPWFQQIDTSHEESGVVSNDSREKSCFDHAVLSPLYGQFLSTQQQVDGSFVDAYLQGGYAPYTPFIELQGSERKWENYHYDFDLWVRQGSNCTSHPTSNIEILYEVLDSFKIPLLGSKIGSKKILQNPKQALEELVEEGAAKLTIRVNWKNVSTSFDELNKAKDVTLESVDWLHRNLAVLANVVCHLGPIIHTIDGKKLTFPSH